MKFWDSSALVALLVDESDSAQRIAQLAEDPVIVVWWGTVVECESALQRRLREGALNRKGVQAAHVRLSLLAGAWHEVVPSAAIQRLATRLLRTHPLRAADSLQLAAALTIAAAGFEALVFLSADRRLNDAAQIENLTVPLP